MFRVSRSCRLVANSIWPVAATNVAATGQKTDPWRDFVPPNHPFDTASELFSEHVHEYWL